MLDVAVLEQRKVQLRGPVDGLEGQAKRFLLRSPSSTSLDADAAVDLHFVTAVGADELDRCRPFPGDTPIVGVNVDPVLRTKQIVHVGDDRNRRDRRESRNQAVVVGRVEDDRRVHVIIVPGGRKAGAVLDQHVIEKDVRVADRGRRLEGCKKPRCTDDRRSADVNRTAVQDTALLGRFAAVEGIVDLRAGGRRRDRQVERCIIEATVVAEDEVRDRSAGQGFVVRRTGRGTYKAAFGHQVARQAV